MATLDTDLEGGDTLACRVRVVSSRGRVRIFAMGEQTLAPDLPDNALTFDGAALAFDGAPLAFTATA